MDSVEEGCKIPCKGKNFKANHNNERMLQKQMDVVKYPAKVRILKQITTPVGNIHIQDEL